MSIQQKLHLKLGQKLVMTPSLQQAIKLLPLRTLGTLHIPGTRNAGQSGSGRTVPHTGR